MNKDMRSNTASRIVTDAETIQRVVSGDVNAFEILLRRYKGHVVGVVKSHVPSSELDDVSQNVFVRVYRSLATYRGKSNFKNWLTGIAIRTCYDFWRKRYKHKEVPISNLSERHQKWLGSVMAEQSADAYHAAQGKEEAREVLNWALNRLSAADRMVLTLVYLEGLSGKEAAGYLGWSVANVKVRSFRARNKLKTIVTKFMEKGW